MFAQQSYIMLLFLVQVRLFGHGTVESDNEKTRETTRATRVMIRMSLTMHGD